MSQVLLDWQKVINKKLQKEGEKNWDMPNTRQYFFRVITHKHYVKNLLCNASHTF